MTRRVRDRIDLAADVALIGAICVAAFVAPSPIRRTADKWWAEHQTRAAIHREWPRLANRQEFSIGGDDVQLAEFVDYECPSCRIANAALDDFLTMHRSVGVRVVQYPLQMHVHAGGAARAAICAGKQSRFREMHKHLMSVRNWLSGTDWKSEAEAAGVADIDAFTKCLNAPETESLLQVDRQLAVTIGVHATPTVVYKYGIHNGMFVMSELERLIR